MQCAFLRGICLCLRRQLPPFYAMLSVRYGHLPCDFHHSTKTGAIDEEILICILEYVFKIVFGRSLKGK